MARKERSKRPKKTERNVELGGEKKEKKELSFFMQTVIIFGVFILVVMIYLVLQPNGFANLKNSSVSPVSQMSFENCTKTFFANGQRDSFAIKQVVGNMTATTASRIAGTETVDGTTYKVRETISQASEVNGNETNTATKNEKMYLSDDWRCVFQTSVISINGLAQSGAALCPDTNANFSMFKTCADSWKFIKQETITTGAGTFDAEVYDVGDNATIWVSSAVNVPIKVEMNGEGDLKFLMTLESYTKG